MHNAPAVTYPVGRSPLQGGLLGLAGLGAALAGWLWRQQTNPAGWRQGLFAMTLLGVCIVAGEVWRRSPRGSLRWDGQVWSWTSGDVSVCGALRVHFDLQFFLVLSLRPDRGARLWLWPQRTDEVALWNALRRAVFSRRGAGQDRDARADADWTSR